MDYPRGLQALQACIGAGDVEALSELAVLKSRLTENQRKERIFGGNETTRSERAQVIYALNEMALQHCGLSFN